MEECANKKEELLSFFALDKNFSEGEGDWLWFEENGERKKVLDVVGSYGINLLGFNNPRIKKTLIQAVESKHPVFTQASKHPELTKLSSKIIELVNSESKPKQRFCEFSNTGSEAIEMALKICCLDYEKRVSTVKQEINYSKNHALKVGDKGLLKELESNDSISFEGQVLHLSNSFHGKTLGSLSVIDNPKLKGNFPTAFSGVEIDPSEEEVLELLNSMAFDYWVYDRRSDRLITKKFCPYLACVIEPIRGEGGILEITKEFAQSLDVFKRKYNVPLISDEIQTGLFRTGKMASIHHLGLEADIYCFGKMLGGGVTKIGAVCALASRFETHFFKFHSTSFGEDYYSTVVASEVLNLLEGEKNQERSVLEELHSLRANFPKYVKSVRGKGLLFAIELENSVIQTSFVRKYMNEIGMMGYWISSVLLEQEGIRILPTLSAPMTFRVQPSIYITKEQIQKLIEGFTHLFEALERQDLHYLFNHIIPLQPEAKENFLEDNLKRHWIPENAAVFLCHPIDTDHFGHIIDLTANFQNENLEEIVSNMSSFHEYEPYYVGELFNAQGDRVDVVFLGIPFTSETFYRCLKSGNRTEVIGQIQRAVDWANQRKARVVGLGQFTSIITDQGLRLNSDGAKLTTGNSYTAKITIDAMLLAIEERGWALADLNLGLVGAAGNIVSVISKFVTGKVRHISLVYHKEIWKSKKNRKSITDILTFMSENHFDSCLSSTLKKHLGNLELEQILEKEIVSKHISVHSDVSILNKSCDILITGANAPHPFITNDILKENSILVDIAVPGNVDTSELDKSITYIKGGIVGLPMHNNIQQQLNSSIFPFELGESFACMAETIGLSFNQGLSRDYIGDIDLDMVKEVGAILNENGFSLRRNKVKNSV